MTKNKIDAPFSELVVPYFKTHSNNEHLEIHCGANAYLYAEWDAMYPKHVRPSLCLPHLHDFQLYWWPVADLRIFLIWKYKDTERQVSFANYLVNVCRAFCVWTSINGDEVKFMNKREQGRLAA